MRQLLAVDLHIERGLLAVDHVKVHALDSRFVAALVREGHDRFDARLDSDLRLEVSAVAIVVRAAIILIQRELGIYIGGHQDVQRGGLFGHQVMQGVPAHRDDGTAAHKQRNAGNVDRHLNGLAGGVFLAGVEVVEPLVFVFGLGQVDRANGLALLDNVGHQQRIAEHEIDTLIVGCGVILEHREGGLPDGQAVLMRALHQRVERRAELVAEVDGLLDVLLFVAVHPRLGNGVVGVGRMDGEARLEDAVLHPAHKQLTLRRGAEETADVAAVVGNAAERHAQDRSNVVFQGIPAGQVVTGPDLCIPLDTGVTGTADREGTAVGVIFLDGLVGQLAHQVAHDRLHRADRAALTLKIDLGVLINKGIILAVVVPDGAAAVLEQRVLDVLLPVQAGGFLRVVYKEAGAAPPCADSQTVEARVVIGGGQEHALLLHLVQQRVNQQHAGLDVGRDDNAALFHLGEPVCRVLEALVVPCEGAALDALGRLDCAITAGKLEPVCGDALLAGGVDEIQHRVIAVLGQFGVIHRAAKVAECSLRQHDALAGQVGVALDDLADGRACDQEQINIARIGAVGRVAMPVVALLAPHVEITLGRVVVEVTDRLFCAAVQPDIKRNVLVERVGLLGVVAHRIAGGHIHVFLSLVDLAGLLTEAVEAVIGLDLAGMDAAAVAVLAVGKVRNVGVQQAAVLVVDHDAEGRFLDDDLQALALDHSLLFAIGQNGGSRLYALAAALHQGIGAGLPCGHRQAVGGLVPVAVKAGADAQDVIGQKPDAQLHSVGCNGIVTAAVLDSTAGVAHFHRFSPFFFCVGQVEKAFVSA